MSIAIIAFILALAAAVVLFLAWRTVRFMIRLVFFGAIILLLVIGLVWWRGWGGGDSETPRKGNRPPAAKPRRTPVH